MNRIQGKDHKIGIYETNKISLSSFDNEIYIQNNGCNGLSELVIKRTVILIIIKKAFLSSKLF